MQRLKQSGAHCRFFAEGSLHVNNLPAHIFGVQVDNQAGVAITKLVQYNGSCGG